MGKVIDLIAKNCLVEIVEASIDNLLSRFKVIPYFFYTENDLHTYLYHEIYSRLPIEEWQCTTIDDRLSILLHKEYPTKARYIAKNLQENETKGARGHFDLCIWNPERTKERLFRLQQSTDFRQEQQTFIALEFDMIEANDSLDQAIHHFKWDLLKLRSGKNEVEHGYSLVFVRDWAYSEDFLKEIKNEIAGENRIVALYAERRLGSSVAKSLSKRTFPNYEPMFK